MVQPWDSEEEVKAIIARAEKAAERVKNYGAGSGAAGYEAGAAGSEARRASRCLKVGVTEAAWRAARASLACALKAAYEVDFRAFIGEGSDNKYSLEKEAQDFDAARWPSRTEQL